MNTHTPPNLEPDGQFIDAFEQQLRAGIRRRALLDPTTHTSGRVRRKGTSMFVTASLMLLSLTLGATGTFAVVHQDLAPHRELHLQRATILLDRARVRLEQRVTDLEEVEPLVEQGLASDVLVARSRRNLAEAESLLRRRELDLQETTITGRAPVDDLTAPLVDGEDFVTARLEGQLRTARLALEQAERELTRFELLVDSGVVSDRELIGARADLEAAVQDLARIDRHIELRHSFLAGDMPPEDVELRALLRDTEADRTIARSRLEAAATMLQRIAVLHEHGAVTTSELREAQTALRDAESNLALADVQFELIERRLAPPQ